MFKQLFTFVGLMAFALSAQSELVNNDPNNLVTNGSFTDVLKNGDAIVPGTPTGWSVGANNGEAVNSPDTMDETANFGDPGITNFAATPDATPDGETWVGLARDGAKQNERISQTVNNFSIGSEYTISWYEGNFGFDIGVANVDFLSANAIEVNIGNDYTFSSTTNNPGNFLAIGSEWVTRSFTFQATQTSYDVSFGLISPNRSFQSLDGVSITAVAAVPEPSTYAMLLAGGLLVVGFKRKQRS